MMHSLLFALLSMVTVQHQHGDDRAAQVMGFDQTRNAHHFHLYADGGAIDVGTKDSKETKDTKAQRDAIRAHLSHIATMFKGGNFDAPMLVHDTKNVPGIEVMAAHRNEITYRYADTPRGGRVDVITTDPTALKAVHEFLRYQIREHNTGDAGQIEPRG